MRPHLFTMRAMTAEPKFDVANGEQKEGNVSDFKVSHSDSAENSPFQEKWCHLDEAVPKTFRAPLQLQLLRASLVSRIRNQIG